MVEIDAEDGDHVKKGQLLARLDRSQLDAQLGQSDAALARADAAIDQAKSMIAQSASQLDFAASDYDRAKKLGPGDHGGLDRRAARDQHEIGAGGARRRPRTRSRSP